MGYAIVWTTDRGYMPGTNGVLNALEHYDFDLDSYVLTYNANLDRKYKNQWPRTVFEDIDFSFWPEKKAAKWYLLFADIHKTYTELLDRYDAVLIWGADVCPVNDFMWLFEVSEKLDAVVVGTNQFGAHPLDMSTLAEKWPYPKAWKVPFADIPFILTPNHKEVLRLMLDYHTRPDNQLSHMNAMNYAIRDSGVRYITVPGEIFNCNRPDEVRLRRVGDKLHFGNSATELYAFHRKYWMASLCRKYHSTAPICMANKKMFNRMWYFLNTQLRVKWTEGLELWDGT